MMPSLPKEVDYWYSEATVQLRGQEFILRLNEHDLDGYYAGAWVSGKRCNRDEAVAVIPAEDFERCESIDDLIDRLVNMTEEATR